VNVRQESALLIVGHGSTVNPDSSAPTLAHAARSTFCQGPLPIEILARVAAQVGEPDRAIATLQKLLSIPYAGPLAEENMPLTPALLRLDPVWDQIRNDPRFQELAAEKKP
jgi:hypothetical protein